MRINRQTHKQQLKLSDNCDCHWQGEKGTGLGAFRMFDRTEPTNLWARHSK